MGGFESGEGKNSSGMKMAQRTHLFAVSGATSLSLDALFRKESFRFLPVLPRSRPSDSLPFQLSDFNGSVLSPFSFQKGWLLSVPFKVVPRKVKNVHVCSLGHVEKFIFDSAL